MTDDHDQSDPAETLMREVGAQLRQVRLERGEELDDVAQHLRIKPTYLFGIEQGDLSMMPGRTYALGFLRSYAGYLGFDGDDLIVQIKSTVANLTDRTRLRIRTPLPESRLPKMPVVVLSLAAIAGVYAGWSYLNRSSQVVVETVAEVPADLRGLAPHALREADDAGARPAPTGGGVVEQATPPGAGPAARHQAEDGLASTTESTASAARSDPARLPPEPEAGATATIRAFAADRADPAPAAPEAAVPGSPAVQELVDRAGQRRAAPEPAADGNEAGAGDVDQVATLPFDPTTIAATGQLYEAENTDARVVLRGLGSSWIRLSSVGGDYLRTLTLEPGDVFLVPNRPDLELWTGNAGGLEVILDGAVLAPLGSSGAVMRAVALDPSSLRARFGRPIVR